MKTFVLVLTMLASSFSYGAQFSAFTNNNVLYVTVLGDSCNAIGGDLKVAGICDKNRLTANYATTCAADLSVMMTEMACGNDKLVAKTIEFDLSVTNVAPEAEVLELKYSGSVIEVEINK